LGVDQRRGNKRTKSGNEKSIVAALELAHERVKANAVMVSVGPGSLQSGTADETTPAAGRKKDKKSKKMVRMAGGQIWEDNSLLEWEDGKLPVAHLLNNSPTFCLNPGHRSLS
jgi:hypothetical protein